MLESPLAAIEEFSHTKFLSVSGFPWIAGPPLSIHPAVD